MEANPSSQDSANESRCFSIIQNESCGFVVVVVFKKSHLIKNNNNKTLQQKEWEGMYKEGSRQ